jgi:hypothetical protein
MKKEEMVSVSTQASCVDSAGVIWFFSNDYNALFSYKDGKTVYRTTFEKEKLIEQYLYNEAYLYETDIFFFPVRAKRIACYSTLSTRVSYIDIPQRTGTTYYNVITKSKSEVYLVPQTKSSYAYLFDLETGKFTLFPVSWTELGLKDEGLLIGDAYVESNIYLAAAYTNRMWKINLENRVFERIELPNPIFKTRFYNGSVYMLSSLRSSRVMKYSREGVETVFWGESDNESCNKYQDMQYSDFFLLPSGGIMMLPMQGDSLYIKDGNEEKLIPTGRDSCQYYDDFFFMDRNVVLMPYEGEFMLTVDMETYQYFRIELAIPKRDCIKLLREHFREMGSVMTESEHLSLDFFLSMVMEKEEK